MLARGGGSIVMIGSVNATLPEWNIVDYSASKAAMANFAKSLSKEFGPKGIRVNTVSPGPVATDLWLSEDGIAAQFAAASGATAEQVADSVVAGSATGRFTTPQEVADLAVFLAGEHSANITGSDIRIDGGYVPTM
jgi:NAD(P)-dependent dehydrogenase (short-subunit alcohol dehydrogenase family)